MESNEEGTVATLNSQFKNVSIKKRDYNGFENFLCYLCGMIYYFL